MIKFSLCSFVECNKCIILNAYIRKEGRSKINDQREGFMETLEGYEDRKQAGSRLERVPCV